MLKLFSHPSNLAFIAPPVIGALSFASATTMFPTSQSMTFLGLCVFHVCAGIYLPSSAILRSVVITNDGLRATILALLRVPLNVAVMLVAIDVAGLSLNALSIYVLVLCIAASAGQYVLVRAAPSLLSPISYKPLLASEIPGDRVGASVV
jgi:hypothetical protein